MNLPTVLQGARALYTTAALDTSLVCSAHAPARVYLLWPALQPVPLKLATSWHLVSGAEVKVRWAGFSLKQRAWLNITNQRRAYEEQPLLLYTLASNSALAPGAQLQLPAFGTEDGGCLQETPCRLGLPPVVVLCSARGDASKPSAAVIGATAARWNSNAGAADCVVQLLREGAADLSGCPLDEICSAVEEGDLDASSISQATADALLHKAMAAGDDELLLMLVQADEMTWVVRTLVASKNMFDVEQLLASYVLTRRNALSSTAAIKHAVLKAATAGFVTNHDALQLAKRFKAAKHALLRQLMKRYSDEQRGCAAATAAEDSGSLHAPGRNNLQLQLQMAHLPGSDRYQKPGVAPLALLNPLLHTVKLCLQETTYHVIGRGGGMGRFSIHDSSPYSLAMALGDSEFLGLQPVRKYTRLIWRGMELHKMRHVLWQTLASADEAAAADGPFSSSQTSRQPADAAAHDSKHCTGKLHSAAAAATDHADEGITPDPRLTRLPACLQDTMHVQLLTSIDGLHAPRAAGMSPGSSAGPCAEGVESSSNSSGSLGGSDAAAAAQQPASRPGDVSSSYSTASGAVGAAYKEHTAMAKGSKTRRQSTMRTGSTYGAGDVCAGVKCTSAAGSDSSAAAAAVGSRWMDPHAGCDLLQNLGLAGGLGSQLVVLGVFLLHGVLVAPRSLHDSSWGRWVKRMVFEVTLLVIYQTTVLGASHRLLLAAFPALLLGNVIDIIYQLKFKWDGNLRNYLQDHWSKLDVLVNFGLLALLVWEYVCWLTGVPLVDAFGLTNHGIHLERVVQAAFAVLVWSRALGLLTPLSSKLGGMLYILRSAAEEVAVLVPVVLVLILGFGTTLTVTHHTTEPKFNKLAGAMRMLGNPNDLRLAEFDDAGDGNPFLVVWGQAVTIVYIAVVSILIMSLLVAVITNAYNPESVQAHALVMQAESTFHYDFHAAAGVAAAPIPLRVLPASCLKWWVIPLDGYVPQPIAGCPAMLLATGPSEVGYLAFMFLMYPLFATTGLVLLAAYAPFGVLHFAIKGHTVWLEASCNCCMKLTRAADFWRAADVQAAFSAAKLAVGGPHMQQDQADDTHIPRQSGEVSCSVALPQAQQYIGKAALPRGPLRAAAAYSHIGSTAPAASFEGDDSSHVSSPWYSEAGGVIQAVPGALAAKAAALRAASGFDGRDIDDENVGSLEREVRQQLIGRVCWASTSGDGSSTTRL
ncbi:hypothetical protein OEZ86_003270 [Tetradesmus obliquus]|nr:hypothetical protein OEZ86_003270 [Tetradesmus obliquus]